MKTKKPPLDLLAARDYFAKRTPSADRPLPAADVQAAPVDFGGVVAAMLAKVTPASAEAVARDRELRRVQPRLVECGIAREHLPALDTLRPVPAQLAALARMRETVTRRDGGAIVVLIGPRGTGKTHLVAQIFRDQVETLLRAEDASADAVHTGVRVAVPALQMHYGKAQSFFQTFKELHGNVGSIRVPELQARLALLAKLDLVAIDELQEVPGEADASRVGFSKILTDIVDQRYAEKLPTILVSNHYDPARPSDLSQITAFHGDSIVSRLNQYGALIIADWPGFRGGNVTPTTARKLPF